MPITERQFDALVIGAGPAGAVAATLLAHAGLHTLLADAKRFPRAKVCGGCLSARALTAIERAGLADVIANCGGRAFDALEVAHAGKRLRADVPRGLALSRKQMDEALVGAAVRAGATFWDHASAQVAPTIDADSRLVRITLDGHEEHVSARVVLVCDGLGHPSLAELPEFRCEVTLGSRVGLGAVVSDPRDELPPGVIHMAVGRNGYVGAVRAEEGQVCVAAAVDRAALAATSPQQLLAEIVRKSQVSWGKLLVGAELRGTRPLTQRATKLADERLFVVGDAAGYVEPFTGEGMAVALESALAVTPLTVEACTNWRPELNARWSTDVRRIGAQRQSVIRGLAWFLRRPRLLRSGLALAGMSPGVVKLVTRRMNRPTAARSI